jgi:alpha-glycerophosphate oxidase/glycerol-3-phosphate dehydrogenase
MDQETPMLLRKQNIAQMKNETFDVAIIGAGINGAVAAAALSAKGVKVALIDKGDFAGFTSSNSSNLAWGGIKYLESHEYRLVSKLCKSRNLLMESYPSTVKEIRFLTCIQKGFRFPPFFVYLGTLIYWLFGRFYTQRPNYLTPKKISAIEPVINTSNAQGGFEYSDAYLFDNDSRFVFNFIRSSLDHGCVAANYVSSQAADFTDDQWNITAQDEMSGETFCIQAKVLINAAGPFVDQYNETTEQSTDHHHVFSKGVHLIVDQITTSQKVLAFFASDGRLFFVIPMGQKTCIGTTDTQVDSPLSEVTDGDRDFILDNVNQLLNLPKPLTKADIIAERCGVRPLAIEGGSGGEADWVKLSRKHAIDVNKVQKYISIFGGKLTDCINVGNEVAEIVEKFNITLKQSCMTWYGESTNRTKQQFFEQARAIKLDTMTWANSAEPLSERFWRRYGANAMELLAAIQLDESQADLLIESAEYTRCEIEYAAKYEMITELEDFLRRRSKISLVVRQADLLNGKGLKEACEILFGSEAEEKLQKYIDSVD